MVIYKHIDFQVPQWGEFQAGPVSRLGYRGEVISDAPLLYLRLGESSGPTVTDEAGGRSASQIGALAWGVSGALAFDPDTAVSSEGGAGLMVNQTGWLPVGSSARTLEYWFRPETGTLLAGGISYGATTDGNHFNFAYSDSELSISVGGCKFGVQGLSLSGGWHHAAIVFPDSGTRCDDYLLYLDGQALSPGVISGSGSQVINTTDTSLLIYQFTTGPSNNCAFDEVAVYSGALTAQRISDHYRAGTRAESA